MSEQLSANQQILLKAALKAINNGWLLEIKKGVSNEKAAKWLVMSWSSRYLIFNQGFAKALWGEKRQCLTCGSTTFTRGGKQGVCMGCDGGNDGTEWQYHLQQMVIAEDPIKYLSENI